MLAHVDSVLPHPVPFIPREETGRDGSFSKDTGILPTLSLPRIILSLERLLSRMHGPVQGHPVLSDGVEAAGFAFEGRALEMLLLVSLEDEFLVRDEVAEATFVQLPAGFVVVMAVALEGLLVARLVGAVGALVAEVARCARLG